MFQIIDTFLFTLERIWQHRILVIWVLVGLSVATIMALSLPLYVDSVYTDILSSRLDDPPYAFRFRYLGAWNGNINQEDVTNASAAIQRGFAETIRLPVGQDVRYIRGGTWTTRFTTGQSLGTFGVSTLEGADSQMVISEGEWNPSAPVEEGAPLPAMIPEVLLYSVGVQLGDIISVQRPGGPPQDLEIVALWRPINEDDPSWIFPPKFFDQVILVAPDTLWQMLEGVESPIDESAWFLIFDGSELRTAEVDSLLGNITDGLRGVEAVLPGIRQDLSPKDGLEAFNEEVNQLTQQLFIIVLPVGGLVLYFVSMVAGLLVSRQQVEDVKLRSRGMSRRAILLIHILMWLLLVGIALAIGMAASPWVVRLVGQTTSFLRFEDAESLLEVTFTLDAIVIGAGTGLIAASSGLFLAWKTTRQNINSFRQANVGTAKAWWQRAYLDMLLLGIAVYVLYTLNAEGGLVTEADSPFSDPLAFLGPTIFALGVTLLFLRLWPILLGIAARLVGYTRNIALLMALRELTRSIGRYRGALLMMSFTLSLTGFTASMASTIDRSLVDSINYRIGADMVLVTAADAQTETGTDGGASLTVTGYNAPPVQELVAIDGIDQFSRVGTYPGRLVVGSQRVDGTIMGMDRGAMAAVTRFREDFSTESVAELFNLLAGNRTGILLDRQTAETYNLIIGQEVEMQVSALTEWYDARVPILGFLDYFPTLDPSDGFFLLTSIDPIFEMAGTDLPHDVWLTLSENADPEIVQQDIIDIEFPVLRWLEPESELKAAQGEPARRGVLGFLSVGFVASIVLTLIGAIIQNTASFRAQSAQLGSLRAMGLGGFSVAIYMILLQGMAAASGIMSGTSIGVATTELFLPLLDFSGGLPPYLIRVAWAEIIIVYAVFAGVMFFVTMFTSLMLSREQLTTVVKLGEA